MEENMIDWIQAICGITFLLYQKGKGCINE
jgi:hypothetical protein